MREEFQKKLVFKVIVSNDGQYSLWLLDRELPPGWRDAEPMQGSALECLAFIKELYFRVQQPETARPSSSEPQENASASAAYA